MFEFYFTVVFTLNIWTVLPPYNILLKFEHFHFTTC